MINKILDGINEAGNVLKEQAGNLSGMTKEKAYQIIEDWLQIFPKLQAYGLRVTSFGLSIALSPALEVELMGKREDFTDERLIEIISENADDKATTLVMNTIKNTYRMYAKAGVPPQDPLLLRICVKIPPEVNVFIGTPQVFK